MRCEAFETIVFSGGEVTQAMREHARSCEACRALLENADVLADAPRMDAEMDVPASFAEGWRAAVRRDAARRAEQEKQPTLLERVKALFAGNNRRAVRGLAYALCAVALVGVGAQFGERETPAQAYGAQKSRAAGVMLAENAAMDGGVMMTSMAYDEAAEEEAAAVDGEQKIIRTAQIDIDVEDMDAAMQAIAAQVESVGGTIGYREVSGRKGEGRWGSMEIKVPSAGLDSFLVGAGSLGTVTRNSSQQTDMTGQYRDNASRLESAKAQKQRLDELYAQAEDMADVVAITDALFDVQQEIDSLTGANQHIDDRAAMSRVYVSLSEPAQEEALSFWAQLAARFAEGFGAIGSFFTGIVLFAAWALPWAALIAVIAGAILFLTRKHRR